MGREIDVLLVARSVQSMPMVTLSGLTQRSPHARQLLLRCGMCNEADQCDICARLR
jgi:hypothetical protein